MGRMRLIYRLVMVALFLCLFAIFLLFCLFAPGLFELLDG